MNKKWSDAEKQIVIAHYSYSSDKELCQLIEQNGGKHSLDSVRKFRQRLQLKKSKGRPKSKNSVNTDNLVKTPVPVYGEALVVPTESFKRKVEEIQNGQ